MPGDELVMRRVQLIVRRIQLVIAADEPVVAGGQPVVAAAQLVMPGTQLAVPGAQLIVTRVQPVIPRPEPESLRAVPEALLDRCINLPEKRSRLPFTRNHLPRITHRTLGPPMFLDRTRCLQDLIHCIGLTPTNPDRSLKQQEQRFAPGGNRHHALREGERFLQALSRLIPATPLRQRGNFPGPNRRLLIIVLTFRCSSRCLRRDRDWITVGEPGHPGQSLRPKPWLINLARLQKRLLWIALGESACLVSLECRTHGLV